MLILMQRHWHFHVPCQSFRIQIDLFGPQLAFFLSLCNCRLQTIRKQFHNKTESRELKPSPNFDKQGMHSQSESHNRKHTHRNADKQTCIDCQISRIRTFLPLISQVMCGAGRPRVVLQSAKSFSPMANGVRLRNLIEGGPVCGTVKWEWGERGEKQQLVSVYWQMKLAVGTHRTRSSAHRRWLWWIWACP